MKEPEQVASNSVPYNNTEAEPTDINDTDAIMEDELFCAFLCQ